MFILFFNFRAFEIPPLPCRLIMVRLKISLDNHSKLSLEHFDSIMVRLTVAVNYRTQGGLKFQFH